MKNFTKNSMLASALCFIASATPLYGHADTLSGDPVTQLFGAISNLGKSLAHTNTPKASSTDQNGASTTPDVIMKQLASQQTFPACSSSDNQLLQKNIARIMDQYKMGQYATVGANAQIYAEQVSACTLNYQTMSLPQAQNLSGQLLALSSISNHNAGMDTQSTLINAQNALVLLKLNPSSNKNLIEQIEKSGILPAKPAVASKTPLMTMSAHEVATKYIANSFAFDQKYSGKTLQVRGEIQSISGSANAAYISLIGVRTKDINDEGWNDVVRCDITEKSALEGALNISKGETIAIQGLYDPEHQALKGGVELQDCKIVQ